MLASTLRRPRWPMPIIAPSRCVAGRLLQRGRRGWGWRLSPPSIPNRFWPRYLVPRNFSNASAALSRPRMWRCSSAASEASTPSTCSWIQAFSSGSWMCMYSMPDGAAVGVAEDVEHVAEQHGLGAGHAVGQELAVEVPDGEAVGGGIELAVHVRLLPRQRIEVGDEVAPHPVHVDQAGDVHLLLEPGLLPVDRVVVLSPPHRLVGDAERAEDLDVELLLAHQHVRDALEEQARLGALDDAVVVGGARPS